MRRSEAAGRRRDVDPDRGVPADPTGVQGGRVCRRHRQASAAGPGGRPQGCYVLRSYVGRSRRGRGTERAAQAERRAAADPGQPGLRAEARAYAG